MARLWQWVEAMEPEARIHRCLLLFVAVLSSAAGCRRDEITHFRVNKSAAPALSQAAVPASPEVAPPPAPDGALGWTLPKGWTESGADGMRYATLKPGSGVDVSVVVLPGPAGGELANVNRWRGQLGLGALDEASLASARKAVQSQAGTISLYDFTSGGAKKSRLVAGLTVLGGSTWFVKMVGDAGPVGAARPEFIHLIESLRP